jgi:hypothetical protein
MKRPPLQVPIAVRPGSIDGNGSGRQTATTKLTLA